ncbi:TIGR03668 family PPOX class F420-dependent oxidoreductase [Reyranella sp.]|uniref:TIGR03668 family PPOX class F420-dependent oxidoreductase n=1 Tax=Reyranella sp. TaxID=1929291 RepID=UPI003BA891DC
MLSTHERAFVERRRVGHLATADAGGTPQVVPVCFGLAGDTVFIAIDRKPKRGDGRSLKRLRNIAANPRVAIVFDHYDEDWRRLAWVMLHGRAEILSGGPEHGRAQALVQARYPQLAAMRLEDLPVIAIRIERTTSWGDLDAGPDGAPAGQLG